MSTPAGARRFTEAERELTRRWLNQWKTAGPALEAERVARLHAMNDKQRARMTLDLLSLWRSDLPGDDGDALVRVQRAFASWRKKRA